MNFSDLKKSFLKDHYPILNDMVMVFDTKDYSEAELNSLSLEARKYVDCGFLFQTSGTTSDKKFVLHDFESIKTSNESINAWVKVSKDDKFLAPISIHHMGGFSLLSRAFIAGISEPIILKSWSLNEFIQIVEKENITVTSMVPSQIYEIVQANVKSPKSLKAIFVGGSAIDHSIYLKAKSLGWPVLKTFGSSEACSQIFTQKLQSTMSSDDLSLYLLPHWTIKMDADQRLMVKGKSLYKGYLVLKDEHIEFIKTPLDENDFFLSEDRLQVTGDRLEAFLGRLNDYVKINSTLVHLATLRSQFYQFCLDQKIDAEKTVLAVRTDIKSGLYLSVVSEVENPKLVTVIQNWNETAIAAERIRGIYYKSIPRTELGKIKYKDL